MAPVGDPTTEILAAAQQTGADVIVVARHRAKVPHALGTVSGRIVRRAHCDVLVVHAAGDSWTLMREPTSSPRSRGPLLLARDGAWPSPR